MKFYRETTVWAEKYPNHTYLLTTDKSRMYGFLRHGTEEVKVFKKPIGFDARGRTFKIVKELGEVDMHEVKGERWEFTGSRGDTYIVERLDGVLRCSCPGYTFRGDCKHVKEIV